MVQAVLLLVVMGSDRMVMGRKCWRRWWWWRWWWWW